MAALGGLTAPALTLSSRAAESPGAGRSAEVDERKAKIDAALARPVLKKELFSTPIIIESLELLRLDNRFLCRVRSKDGAVGVSVAHSKTSPLKIVKGSIQVPTGPGWGIEIDPDFIRKHAVVKA